MLLRISDDSLVNPDVSDRCGHLSQLDQVIALYIKVTNNLWAHIARSSGEERKGVFFLNPLYDCKTGPKPIPKNVVPNIWL